MMDSRLGSNQAGPFPNSKLHLSGCRIVVEPLRSFGAEQGAEIHDIWSTKWTPPNSAECTTEGRTYS